MTGYASLDRPWYQYYDEFILKEKIPEKTIYEYLFECNSDHLTDTALNYYGKKISYGSFFEKIEQTAKAYYNLGVRKNDIVLIFSLSIPETIFSIYALNRLGAIPNMVNPRTSAEGIRDFIKEGNVKTVVTLDALYGKVKKAVIGTNVSSVVVQSPYRYLPKKVKRLYDLTNLLKFKNRYDDNVIKWNSFIENGKSALPKYTYYEPNECAVIVHTGGTTGPAKAVQLTNENINSSALQIKYSGVSHARGQIWLNIMPPYIAYGVGNGLHLPLICGMEIALIPKFNPLKFDKYIIEYKPNHLLGTPSHFAHLIKSPSLRYMDLSFLEAPVVGGDAIDLKLEEDLNDFLDKHNCHHKVIKGYGMTEVCAAACLCPIDELFMPGSVGIPLPFTTMGVFDFETQEELKYGVEGELCIKGPTMMKGYYGNKEATNEVIKKHSDGSYWVHSGDIGYISKEGLVFIQGRSKRMIIRPYGTKVYPALIENVIMKNPYVTSCCVVGASNEKYGQGKAPVAFVTLEKGLGIKEIEVMNEIQKLCNELLLEYQRPIEYKVIEKLPYTLIGKVDYRILEDLASKLINN